MSAVHLDGGPDRTLCGIVGLERWRKSGVRRSDTHIVLELSDGVSCARCKKIATAKPRVYCVECGMNKARLPVKAPVYCTERCGYRSAIRLFNIAANAALDADDQCYFCGARGPLCVRSTCNDTTSDERLACEEPIACARRCHANSIARVRQKHLPDIA